MGTDNKIINSPWDLLAGVLVLLLGVTVSIGWLSRQPALIQLLPGSDGMPYSTAAGFVLAGLLLVVLHFQPRRPTSDSAPALLPRVLALLLLLLGVGALLEWQAGMHLGLSPDPRALQQWFADPNPFAGHMRPLAAYGFISAGLVALLIPRINQVWAFVTAQTLALLIMFVGCVGVLGHAAGFSVVFDWYLGPVLAAALGFIVCGFGLALLVRQGSTVAHDEESQSSKISLVAGAIVVATGIGGILGGFAVLYPQAVGELQNNLFLSLSNRNNVLHNAIQEAWMDGQNFGHQPLLLAAMDKLNHNPADAEARRQIQAVAARHSTFGFTAVAFSDASRRLVATGGAFLTRPELSVPVALPSPSQLLWQQGHVLRVQLELTDQGRRIGQLQLERRLLLGEELNATAPFGDSLDFALCAPATLALDKMDCFPLHSTTGRGLHKVPTGFSGQPLPMYYALSGKSGLIQAKDYRGIPVIAAYMPVGRLGLGTVLKIDAADLYQPIARRLGLLFSILTLVAASAVLLLRLQVVPLVHTMAREIKERKKAEARLQESEATLAEITATLGEGLCVLDEQGIVTFINPEAERLLGWPTGELLGKDAHAAFHHQRPDGTLVPASQCPIHLAIQAGEPYRTLDEWYVRKDGSFLPVSIITRPIFREGTLKGSVASFQDISERKRIEQTGFRLTASLRHLSEIAALSHLPLTEQFRRALVVGTEHFGLEFGIVSHIDGDHYEIVSHVSPPDTLADGQAFPLGNTYCAITLAEAGVLAISHMAASPHLGHPCYREFKLETYIGAAIRIGDEIFGTVNFSSPAPFHRSFDDGDREFVILLARWAASAIERHRAMEAISHAANFDPLTNLPNRGLFFDRLGQALAQAQREGHSVALLFLDLDHFKKINDTLGHEAGDLLLKAVSQRLSAQVREMDTVARLAGDEFIVILPRMDSIEGALRVADKIIAAVSCPFELRAHRVSIGVSIGVALFPKHGSNVELLLGAADEAMYQAKQAGRNTVRVYGAEEEKSVCQSVS